MHCTTLVIELMIKG